MTDQELNIRIARIRELTAINSMSRLELLRHSGGEIAVSFNSRLIPLRETGKISLVTGVKYRRSRNMIERTLLHYNIETVFEIDDIGSHVAVDGDNISVPPRLLTLMYTVAIGALRGMLSQRTARTFLADYPLPLINVSEIVDRMLHPGAPDAYPLNDLTYG